MLKSVALPLGLPVTNLSTPNVNNNNNMSSVESLPPLEKNPSSTSETKTWNFYKKLKPKTNKHNKSKAPSPPVANDPPVQKVLVDQGQQYDENDIPQYYPYNKR